MTNIERAQLLISNCQSAGVVEVVMCPGARNSPLVVAVQNFKNIKVWSFFDERSAGFFALGRIRNTKAAIAVVTTSGTAAAELLPACIEAWYDRLPLILITGDRPPQYRGTGAPQSILQTNLFTGHVQSTFDFTHSGKPIPTFEKFTQPIHLNICFDEPLIDSAPQFHKHSPKSESFPCIFSNNNDNSNQSEKENFRVNRTQTLNHFLDANQKPLIIVGPYFNDSYSKTNLDTNIQSPNQLLNLLLDIGAPVYCEALSQISGHPLIDKLQIRGGEQILGIGISKGWWSSVIRIGGVPTTRFWRDLESKFSHIPVLNITNENWPGLSRNCTTIEMPNYKTPNPEMRNRRQATNHEWKTTDKILADYKLQLLQEFPLAEQSVAFSMSKMIPSESFVYLGNSLPIRFWDNYSSSFSSTKPLVVGGNRGANGIDGQISTFLGWASEQHENWGIFGDLTTLYDLNALWISPKLSNHQLRLVIINNGGGQIFSRMFEQSEFINAHNLSFEHWAKMWSWTWSCHTHFNNDAISDTSSISRKHIFEIHPDINQTNLFWSKWDKLCKSI